MGGTFNKMSLVLCACASTQCLPCGGVVGTDVCGEWGFTKCTLLGPEGPGFAGYWLGAPRCGVSGVVAGGWWSSGLRVSDVLPVPVGLVVR